MTRAGRFTVERRERLLTLLESGRNVEQAAADVGVNPSTVARWAAQGRASATALPSGKGPSTEQAEFARRFDAIRQCEGARLTEDDVVRALEQAIRNGSVTAMRIWFDRFAEDKRPAVEPDEFDELKARRAGRAG